PPSIIMIVYGVAANVSIAKLFLAGVMPGLLLGTLFMLYIAVWALFNKDKVPAADASMTLVEKLYASRHLIPVVALIGLVLGSIYSGVATATEAAALGVTGSLILAAIEGALSWKSFVEGLAAACRVYCMIGLILAGAAFLTLAMGFVGLPRHLAEYIGALNLSPVALMLALAVFFILLGCFLDGISLVVLTIGVLLPTVEAAGFDLIWFGVFVVLTVEMAQITPPVGLNLFVLQGLTKYEVTYIARAAAPLFAVMMTAVFATYYFQDIVLWLPNRM
ncbi:MAG: TRAP transporter large permease subunit, partial [Candidatus Accumulibacter sp.]|nr:TRAP transporter large permease subunit [Accumulibacter sp.]